MGSANAVNKCCLHGRHMQKLTETQSFRAAAQLSHFTSINPSFSNAATLSKASLFPWHGSNMHESDLSQSGP